MMKNNKDKHDNTTYLTMTYLDKVGVCKYKTQRMLETADCIHDRARTMMQVRQDNLDAQARGSERMAVIRDIEGTNRRLVFILMVSNATDYEIKMVNDAISEYISQNF